MAENHRPPFPIATEMVRAHSIAALVTLLISVVFGILVSLQFVLPDLSGGSLVLGWGRLRYAHTQGIMLGWLGNAFLAFLYYAVPVLSGRAVTSKKLGWAIFGLWNFVAVFPGWILVLGGISQPLEWAEFPLVIDFIIIAALAFAACQFLPPFFKHSLDSLYVSSWYIIGSLVFTLLAYPMGNIVPDMAAGATSAAFGGLWIHDAVGLFVTPLALAIIYYVIPASTGRPIFSHFLSMLGFWGLFFFYPLNGTHHYIFSVIPMAAQIGAIAASALLGVIVVIVVTNLLLSMRGAGIIPKDPALRFVGTAVVFYFIVSIQGASQAQMSLNQFVHFTDWVVGHSHLAMMGFATFAGIGGIIHAWQYLPGARYNAKAIEYAFWLLFTGVCIMVIDLTLAGMVQGGLWQSSSPWIESVQASKPYWLVRTLSALPLTAGFVMFAVGLFTGKARPAMPVKTSPAKSIGTGSNHARGPLSGLSMSYLIASVAGIGFFTFSIIILGFWPAKVLDQQIADTAPGFMLELNVAEERGRQIYAREGCAYCHTQQIRYLPSDMQRFGAPTLAWETRYDSPHLWGTRRIGPDLSRAGSTRSKDWHFAHLFAPRTVVPQSVMPSYSALFDGSADKPTQEARDLVAYLETLGRARAIAWPDADEHAMSVTASNSHTQLAFAADQLNTHPAMTWSQGIVPNLESVTPATDGIQLWTDNCAGCHGTEGKGDGPAAQWLLPRPANITEHEYTRTYLAAVLWRGVEGTSMPAWRDLPPEDLTALMDHVQAISATGNDTLPDPAVLQTGRQIYRSNCVQCHGENGDGRGFASGRFAIAPVNFREQRPTIGEGLRILSEGIEGSPMSPWTDRLNDEEMLAVITYVRSFLQADSSGRLADNDH